VVKETLENVLLDGRSRVNLIIEEERIRLGMQIKFPALHRLHMVDQAIVQPIGINWNVRTHINGILFFIMLMAIWNKEVHEAYNMLLDCPWLIDAKVNHD
jgi:hypothetical protein